MNTNWPAPDPDDVVIEEEFDHYVLYVGIDSYTCHSLEGALRTYAIYQAPYVGLGYPLHALWQTARETLSELLTEAQRLDQDWSELPTRNLVEVMDYFNEVHTDWVEEAREDGRTW